LTLTTKRRPGVVGLALTIAIECYPLNLIHPILVLPRWGVTKKFLISRK